MAIISQYYSARLAHIGELIRSEHIHRPNLTERDQLSQALAAATVAVSPMGLCQRAHTHTLQCTSNKKFRAERADFQQRSAETQREQEKKKTTNTDCINMLSLRSWIHNAHINYSIISSWTYQTWQNSSLWMNESINWMRVHSDALPWIIGTAMMRCWRFFSLSVSLSIGS